MKAIIHRQAVVNRLVNNTRPWIVTTPVFELLQNAVYDVVNTSTTTTAPGFIHIPPSGLTIRINEYDKNYVQHYSTLITLKRGDIINIGSASCTLTASPIYNSPTFSIQVDALPVVADGEYTVTITYYSAKDLFDTSIFYAPLTHSLLLTRGTGVATYSRASTATVMGYAPTANPGDAQVVLNCAVNEARFQGARRISEGVWSNTYANGTPISSDDLLGYLSEGARTNLLLQSQAFDNAAWTKQLNVTITPNETTAPDGTLTADKVTWDTAGVESGLFNGVGGAWTGLYNTKSVYVRADVAGGTIKLADSSLTDAVVTLTLSTEWQRISLSENVQEGSVGLWIKKTETSPAEIFVWGAQVEQGAFASSYIPTTTDAVTREADVLSYPKAGNLLDAVGTVYAEVKLPISPDGRIIGGSAEPFVLAAYSSNLIEMNDGTSATGQSCAMIDINKIASKWSGTAKEITGNGNTPTLGTYSGTWNIPTGIRIGTGNSLPLYVPMREVYIWDIALEDYQLSDITTTELHQ